MIGQDADLSCAASAGRPARKGLSGAATMEPDENVPDSLWRDGMKKAPVRKLRFPPPEAAGLCVGKGGVEPPRPFGHTDLNRARLPFRHLPFTGAPIAGCLERLARNRWCYRTRIRSF
jgi:hypothetical protein